MTDYDKECDEIVRDATPSTNKDFTPVVMRVPPELEFWARVQSKEGGVLYPLAADGLTIEVVPTMQDPRKIEIAGRMVYD